MVSFTIRLNEMAVNRRYRRALKAFSNLKPEMERVGDFAIQEGRQRLAARGSEVSLGRLAKSLKRRAFRLAVVISSVLPYARIQQVGGVIRAGGTVFKTGRKWLAIPVRLEDKRRHVWPKHVANQPGVSLRFVPLGPRKALLFYSRKQTQKRKKGRFVKGFHRAVKEYLRWVLVKEVRIKGRPYIVKSAALLRFMRQQLADKWRREMGGAA